MQKMFRWPAAVRLLPAAAGLSYPPVLSESRRFCVAGYRAVFRFSSQVPSSERWRTASIN